MTLHVPTPLQRLLDLGFKRVGEWKLHTDQSAPAVFFDLIEECGDERHVLYAFVQASEVLYIGKSVRTLKKRLYGYQNPNESQITNSRSNKKILELLSLQKGVEIYVFADAELFSYGGFHLNLAAGLEDSLIDVLRPPWNVTGRK